MKAITPKIRKRIPAKVLLIAFLALTVAGASLAETDDPAVVRVGDFTYSQSVVQGSLDSMLELSEMLRGDAPTEEEKAARLQSTIDSFVGLGVIENKLAEADLLALLDRAIDAYDALEEQYGVNDEGLDAAA